MEHPRQGCRDGLSDLIATHVAAPENEEGDFGIFDGGSLGPAMSNASVFADYDPAPPSHFVQPFLIGGIRRKMGIVGLDQSPLRPELGYDLVSTQAAIDEEGDSAQAAFLG
jgi:hypothetical protein